MSGDWKSRRNHIFAVVARTHNPECELLRYAGATIPFTADIGGYGPRPSPGRRGGDCGSNSRRQPLAFSIAPSAFSIRNTIRAAFRSVISTLSPVSRIRFGISITESGSVQ